MKNLLKVELKKAIFSKTFLFGFGLLMLFAFCSALYSIENWKDYNPEYMQQYCMENGTYTANPDFPISSLFSAWLGGDMLSLAYTLFFTFLPVGAALPFAWSYHTERKCGYLKNIATRIPKKKYYCAKTIAVFLSGALAVLLPYLVNILMVSAFVPYYQTWAGYNFYNMVYFGNLWADLFITHPLLHMFLFVALNALYGGIFALLSYAISFYVKNIIAVLFGPFLLMILAAYLEGILINRFFSQSLTPMEFVPTHFLHSREIYYQVIGSNVVLVTVVLLAFSLGTIWIKGRKNEIY